MLTIDELDVCPAHVGIDPLILHRRASRSVCPAHVGIDPKDEGRTQLLRTGCPAHVGIDPDPVCPAHVGIRLAFAAMMAAPHTWG